MNRIINKWIILFSLCALMSLFPAVHAHGDFADNDDPPISVASGSCGDHLSWVFYENGLLEIEGFGPMTGSPWQDKEFTPDIVELILPEALTDICPNAFREMNIECFEPFGAFYVFPSIQISGMGSEEFCEKLIYAQRVAIVPGNAFGECGEGFARVSYSYSLKHIQEALERIERFLNER